MVLGPSFDFSFLFQLPYSFSPFRSSSGSSSSCVEKKYEGESAIFEQIVIGLVDISVSRIHEKGKMSNIETRHFPNGI